MANVLLLRAYRLIAGKPFSITFYSSSNLTANNLPKGVGFRSLGNGIYELYGNILQVGTFSVKVGDYEIKLIVGLE